MYGGGGQGRRQVCTCHGVFVDVKGTAWVNLFSFHHVGLRR